MDEAIILILIRISGYLLHRNGNVNADRALCPRDQCNCLQFKSVRSKRLANLLAVTLRRNVTDASCSHTGRVQRS